MTDNATEEDFNNLLNFLKTLQKQNYYGTLTIQIKKGEIVLIRNESTLRPEELKQF